MHQVINIKKACLPCLSVVALSGENPWLSGNFMTVKFLFRSIFTCCGLPKKSKEIRDLFCHLTLTWRILKLNAFQAIPYFSIWIKIILFSIFFKPFLFKRRKNPLRISFIKAATDVEVASCFAQAQIAWNFMQKWFRNFPLRAVTAFSFRFMTERWRIFQTFCVLRKMKIKA